MNNRVSFSSQTSISILTYRENHASRPERQNTSAINTDLYAQSRRGREAHRNSESTYSSSGRTSRTSTQKRPFPLTPSYSDPAPFHHSNSGRSEYAGSNVTGHRKSLVVPGLPGSTFFTNDNRTSSASIESRSTYNDRALRSDERRGRTYQRSADVYSPIPEQRALVPYGIKDSVTGKELVKYTSGRSNPASWDEDEDDETVVPGDSISQVSTSRGFRHHSGSYHLARRDSGYASGGSGASQTYRGGGAGSMFESAKSSYPDYDVVERRPRWVSGGRA